MRRACCYFHSISVQPNLRLISRRLLLPCLARLVLVLVLVILTVSPCSWLVAHDSRQLMRLRGGVKRATVSSDDADDDAEEGADEEAGPGAVSALTGVFTNVRTMRTEEDLKAHSKF